MLLIISGDFSPFDPNKLFGVMIKFDTGVNRWIWKNQHYTNNHLYVCEYPVGILLRLAFNWKYSTPFEILVYNYNIIMYHENFSIIHRQATIVWHLIPIYYVLFQKLNISIRICLRGIC